MRAEISLRRFFEKVWQVEQFEVQRLRVNLDGPRADRPPEPTANPLAAPKTESHSENSGWLPNRVEVGRAIIRDTQLLWAGGGLRGTAFELQPHEGGWQIAGQGGRLEYAKLPPLDVASLQLRYRAPSLFINSAELRQPGGGSVQATGEVNFERAARPAPHPRERQHRRPTSPTTGACAPRATSPAKSPCAARCRCRRRTRSSRARCASRKAN